MKVDKKIYAPLTFLLLLGLALAGCGDDGSSGGTAPGIYTINASAGNGGSGSGGESYYEGGGILISSAGKTGATVYNVGLANAGFGVPAVQQVPAGINLGTQPLIVTDNLVLIKHVTLPGPKDNTYYLANRDISITGGGTASVNTIWYQVDNTTFKQVTGIQVNEGKVLVLQLNADANQNGYLDSAQFVLRNDLIVNGTLMTSTFDNTDYQDSADKESRGGLMVGVFGQVVVGSKGTITTAGLPNTTLKPAGNGGAIHIDTVAYSKNGGFFLNLGTITNSGGSSVDNVGGSAGVMGNPNCGWYSFGDPSISNTTFNPCDAIDLEAEGYFVNLGKILGNGGNGDLDGGNAAEDIYIYAHNVYNYPSTIASGIYDNNIQGIGGNGTKGYGGEGAWIALDGWNGLYNGGGILANGGNGKTEGGCANYINLWGTQTLRNFGILQANGGSAITLDNSFAASGGDGGDIFLWSQVDLINGSNGAHTAAISANGGNSNDNTDGSAGYGGDIVLMIDPSGYEDHAAYTPPLDLMCSGNLSAKGGSGGNGGHAGIVEILYLPVGGNDYFSQHPLYSAGGIQLWGYTDLIANGGSGKTYGGHAGGIEIITASDAWFKNYENYYDYCYYYPWMCGSAELAPSKKKAANSKVAKQPMDGGGTTLAGGFVNPPGPVANYANITATGGSSSGGQGGGGGYFFIGTGEDSYWAPLFGATPGATPIVNWPNATALNQVQSITLGGGSGKFGGGGGGEYNIIGYLSATHSGVVSMNGGANGVDNTSRGGYGGDVWLFAANGPAQWSGNVSAFGGNGVLTGGGGGDFGAEGFNTTTVSGNFDLFGGNASITAKGTGAKAGSGGSIWVETQKGFSTLSGTTNVKMGTGGASDTYPPAHDGEVAVDGLAR